MKKYNRLLALSLIAISGFSFASFNVEAEEKTKQKIGINREVSKINKDRYKAKTVVSIDDENCTDVVVIFNQSKSMNTADVVGEETYVKVNETNNECYSSQENLYVLDDGEYYKLSVNKAKYHGTSYYFYEYIKNGESLGATGFCGYNKTPDTLSIYRLKKSCSTRFNKSKEVISKVISNLDDSCRVAVVGMSDKESTGLYIDEHTKRSIKKLSTDDYDDAMMSKEKALKLINTIGVTKRYQKDFNQSYAIAKNVLNNESREKNQVIITVTDDNFIAVDGFEEEKLLEQIDTIKTNKYFKSIVLSTSSLTENDLLDKISSNYNKNKVDNKYLLQMTENNSIESVDNIIQSQNRLEQYKDICLFKDELTDKFEVDNNSIKAYMIDKNDKQFEIDSSSVKVNDNCIKILNLNFEKNIDKKLVLNYEFKRKPNFIGGNKVEVYKSTCGLFDINNNQIKSIDNSSEDIEINEINFTGVNLNDVTEYNVKDLLDFNLDNCDNSKVKIAFKILDNKDVVAVCEIEPTRKKQQWTIKKDSFSTSKDFTIQCEIEPINKGQVYKKVITKTAKVKVKEIVEEPTTTKPTTTKPTTTKPTTTKPPTTKQQESCIKSKETTSKINDKEKLSDINKSIPMYVIEKSKIISKENGKEKEENNTSQTSIKNIKGNRSEAKKQILRSYKTKVNERKENLSERDNKLDEKSLTSNMRKKNYVKMIVICSGSSFSLATVAILRYKKALA